MRNSSSGTDDRGNLERLGESAGAMAGRAAEFGLEVSGALFRSAAEMLGGWWSSDAPRQAATSWSDEAERNCRSHYQASAGGATGASSGGASGGMHASGSVGDVSGTMSAGGSVGSTGTDRSGIAPKSTRAAMQSAGDTSTDSGSGGVGFSGSAHVGDTTVKGGARLETSSNRGASAGSTSAGSGGSTSGGSSAGRGSFEAGVAMDSANDGFARARPGYQFGYVARQNPAYRGRSFNEVEPDLRRVWESGAKTQGGSSGSTSSWPEVRGFVDFAYQHGNATERR